MFRLRIIVVGLIATLTLSVTADEPKSTATPGGITADSLNWLVGTWKGIQGQTEIFERWSRQDSVTMAGTGMYLKGADTVVSEQMRMEQTSYGFQFVAIVAQNKGEVAFLLTRRDTSGFVFENPTHDFPTRVIYNPVTNDSLRARIEGPGKDGTTKAIDFVYTRVK